ncbi:MAG: hypothetical protein M3N17_08130 [Actinomycetota bacterium]|nr:hypothetical protein [Actinomycetota bacterium]
MRRALLLMALSVALVAQSPGSTINVPATAGDATDGINEVIAAAPDGTMHRPTVVRFARNGRYRVDGTIRVEGKRHLLVDGNGSTFFTYDRVTARSRKHWYVIRSRDVRIRGMTVRGPYANAGARGKLHPSRVHQAGFHVRDVERLRLRDVAVSHVYGDGVFLGAAQPNASPANWVRNARITDFDLRHIGRQGVAIVSARNVLVARGFVSDTNRNAFSLEPVRPGHGYKNIVIRNNTVGSVGGKMAAIAGHRGTVGSYARFIDNTATATPIHIAIWGLADQHHIWVLRNTSLVRSRLVGPGGRERPPWIIYCKDTPHVYVRANHQPLGEGMRMYATDGCAS